MNKILLDELNNKVVLVTGGTGSFGRTITSYLTKTDLKEIRILSRGEDMQHQMALKWNDSRIRFLIGDVRDENRVRECMRNVDCVFHAAALKQVPDCEHHPFEAVKTNIIGAQNVKAAAIDCGVQIVIFISTDKAVKPVNAMGMTKALQEKIMLSPENDGDTKFCGVRYGNVVGSTGSVIPLFAELRKQGKPLTVTHPEMTRFWLTLDDAMLLVSKALADGTNGDLMVLKRPACAIMDLAKVMSKGRVPVKLGSIRPGEKIHETLVNEEEMRRAIEENELFRICPPGTRGVPKVKSHFPEYTSANTKQMQISEIAKLLNSEGWL